MRNLIIAFALMFSAFTFGQMTFSVASLDFTAPLGAETDANIGWFMTDDMMLSFGMADWDNFDVTGRYYTGFCGNMFVQATVDAEGNEVDGSVYTIGAAVGWTKALGIWKLQFEPMIVLDDIQNFTPKFGWGMRFNL